MKRLAASIAGALLATAAPAQTGPAACDTEALAQIESALDARRLHQAQRMLGLHAPHCADHIAFRRLLAETRLRTGDAEAALEDFLELAAADPQNHAIAAGVGRAALASENPQLALDWLMAATASDEAGWRAWNALGVTLDRLEMWEESAIAYREALRLAPEIAAIWNNRGYSLVAQGNAEEALAYLRAAARLSPNDGRIRRNLAIARGMAGLYPRRSRAAGNGREWAEELNNTGYGALLAGNRTAARSLFARAIEARDRHFSRAARNLDALEDGR